MKIEKIEFDHLRYNPERAGFEALVNVRDGGQVYTYAAHVSAPLHAEYALVTSRLARTAERMHRAKRPAMRIVRPAAAPSYQARVAQILEQALPWEDQPQPPLAA